MTTKRQNLGQKGQTLVIAIMLVMVALIMVPYLVMKVQNEGRWSVKEARTTTAYHQAEAGQDRAVWQLVSSTGAWYNALVGNPTPGYAGDVQYSDVTGGLYDINITSGPNASQVTVITKGRDTSTKEVREIMAVYSGIAMQSGLISTGNFDLNPDFFVYWGQITSYANINQTTVGGGAYTAFTGCDASGNPTGGLGKPTIPFYPYKDASSQVAPWKTTNTPPLCDATKNYCAYDKKLPAVPVLDFNFYRSVAQNSIMPIPKDGAGVLADGGRSAAWVGTGYFNGPGKGGYPTATGDNGCDTTSGNDLQWNKYIVNCSTCAIFFENDNLTVCSGPGSLIVGAMVLFKGNLHLHSNGIYAYQLTPPPNAWQQYTAGTYVTPTVGDTAANNQYPGDCGLNTTCATYTVPNSSHPGVGMPGYKAYVAPTFDQCANTGLSFRGFMYVDGFNCALGNNSISGQVFVGPDGTNIGAGGGVTHVIYYDAGIGAAVRYQYPPLSRVSWNEKTASSWP